MFLHEPIKVSVPRNICSVKIAQPSLPYRIDVIVPVLFIRKMQSMKWQRKRSLHCHTRHTQVFINVFLLSFSLSLFSANATSELGQKIMLDIRYFCQSGSSIECREPVTSLPSELRGVLQQYNIGGVILFAENIVSSAQVQNLTRELQNSMAAVDAPPLFIAVDQEGGRVARLPQAVLPAFSGNMAIGATYTRSTDKFAKQVAKAQASALKQHGINVNFAPVLDVNSNPDNPVINVRAFASDPKMVASLGSSMVRAYQQNGVLSAVKHFPGHGDTNVDSHSGLPNVSHELPKVLSHDIAPFAQVIKDAHPAFVMTAHIQFPNLDNSRLRGKNGASVIVPATLSRKILHDILREELGFDGIVVTDALDMAGITHYFSPQEALVHTFAAGSDIALMPFTIRTPEDIIEFEQWFRSTQDALSNEMQSTMWRTSLRRIASQKVKILQSLTDTSHNLATTSNVDLLYQYHALAKELAYNSITALEGTQPVSITNRDRVLAIMPDELRCSGLLLALIKQGVENIECHSTLLSLPLPSLKALESYDYIILGELSPAVSLVEMGGMEDVNALRQRTALRATARDIEQYIRQVLHQPHLAQKTILLGLRAPYLVQRLAAEFTPMATMVTYDYRVDDTSYESVVFETLSQFLTQDIKPTGTMPVN